jgi:tRNA(His) guanylyltransferase
MQRNNEKTFNWELYSGLKARAPLIIRADGRGFKKILENRKKPYDLDFARSMAGATASLFRDSGLSPILAYTFSDEISLLFLEAPFAGRVEKIDSVVAGFLSGALSLSLGQVISMDCRVIPVCKAEIVEYLMERQDESWRNHVFSYGFYMLVEEGQTATHVMEQMRGMREHEIHELVFCKGINLAKTPAWERRGVLVYRQDGRVVEEWELPLFNSEDGRRLIAQLIG